MASRLKTLAMVWNASKSDRASQGGSMAGLKACTNGCMSVDERSFFSYQVAAGSTMSDSKVVDVIRKSIDSIRSSLPSGMPSDQAMSFGRSSGTVGVARRFVRVVPSRCCRKYSLPLLDEPSRLARQAVSTRGQFFGSSGSVTASFSPPEASCCATYCGDRRPGGVGLVGDVEAAAVELREERHPAHRHRRRQHVHRVFAGESARCRAGWTARRRGSRHIATGRYACTSRRCRSSAAAA